MKNHCASIRAILIAACVVASMPLSPAQVSEAKPKLKAAIRASLRLSIDPVCADDLKGKGVEKASLAPLVDHTGVAYADFLRRWTHPIKGEVRMRELSDADYWRILFDPTFDPAVLRVIEARGRRATHLVDTFHAQRSVIALEQVPADRTTWLQRCDAICDALKEFSEHPDQATDARFVIRQYLPFFAN